MPRQNILCRPKSPVRMIKDTWKVAGQGAGSFPQGHCIFLMRTTEKKNPLLKILGTWRQFSTTIEPGNFFSTQTALNSISFSSVSLRGERGMISFSPTGPTRSWERLRGHCEERPKDIQLAYMQPCSPQTHASQTCHSHPPGSEVAFLQISYKLTVKPFSHPVSWI